MQKGNCQILKAITIKGMTFGIIAGLIVTLFDGLFMLVPNVYVPSSYPILLITFNTIFWITVGGLSGLVMWVFARNRKDLNEKESFYWIFFFLIPFTVIYGLLGRLFIPLASTAVKTASPVFDHHLSFVWVFLMLLFSLAFKRRVPANESLVIFFIPEIATSIALFTFCSNISKIPIISKCIHYLFLQDTQPSYNAYLTMFEKFLILPYAIGVFSILGFYLLAFLKIKFLKRKRNLVVIVLFLMTSLSLAAHFIVNHNRFAKHNYPSTTTKQTSGTKKISYVILIVLDTVRADRLSIYGDSHSSTKNLESIAMDSLVFENCIASSPWTTPSHASLFTGFYPSEHGSVNNLNSKARSDIMLSTPLAEEFLTLAEIFKNNSYKTGAVVSNFGALNKMFRINQGFQIYDATRNIGNIYRLYPFRPIVHLFSHATNIYPKYIIPYRTADDINKETFRALNKLIPSPFFLFINYMDAHDPYCPPRPFNSYFSDTAFPQLYRLRKKVVSFFKMRDKKSWDSFLLSQYDGEIAYLDHHLGKLFSKLKELEIYDSSLVIITSDHGELFGEHGLYFHGTPMYEGVVKVPLVIKFPFSRRVGYEKRMITLADLYPTILSICDLPVPDGISGKSFGNGSMPIVSELNNYRIGEHRILYDGQYKYMTYQHQRKSELYDLKKDPSEKLNLSEKLPVITAAMNKKLKEWIKKHKPRHDKYKDREAIILSQDVVEGLKALGYISDGELEKFKPPLKGYKSIPYENQ
ncbi:MAG: sulfatase-like hydrolase/transferase [Thermodesulfobacteriota bacterium]|jgi:arylsulfatase A-like enzyme